MAAAASPRRRVMSEADVKFMVSLAQQNSEIFERAIQNPDEECYLDGVCMIERMPSNGLDRTEYAHLMQLFSSANIFWRKQMATSLMNQPSSTGQIGTDIVRNNLHPQMRESASIAGMYVANWGSFTSLLKVHTHNLEEAEGVHSSTKSTFMLSFQTMDTIVSTVDDARYHNTSKPTRRDFVNHIKNLSQPGWIFIQQECPVDKGNCEATVAIVNTGMEQSKIRKHMKKAAQKDLKQEMNSCNSASSSNRKRLSGAAKKKDRKHKANLHKQMMEHMWHENVRVPSDQEEDQVEPGEL